MGNVERDKQAEEDQWSISVNHSSGLVRWKLRTMYLRQGLLIASRKLMLRGAALP